MKDVLEAVAVGNVAETSLVPHNFRTYKTIRLEHIAGKFEPFEYTYTSLTRDQALQRSTKALLRQHPTTDRLHWRIVR